MYTQCPDCEIAFKVTAEVLKQAAGKVRCGGCGSAFNALAYLSEQMPKQPVQQTAGSDVPELRPEIIDTDDGLPRSISAEQSAALLKTLDELAGSDIRIEDTGVEWRVLDEEEALAPAADDDYAGPQPTVESVDEYLDDDPTPVDQFLTATPEVIDSPEIFEEDSGPGKTYVDELRFDDNTPLPDDFDLDDERPFEPESEVDDEADAADAAADPIVEQATPDFALSDPDEWTDILGEFQDLAEEVSAPIEAPSDVEEETKAEAEIATADADDIEPDSTQDTNNQPLDMDSQFALQAEAMGIELSGTHQVDGHLEFAEETAFAEDLDEKDANPEPDLDDVISQLELVEADDADTEEELIEEPVVESHSIEEELAAEVGDEEIGDEEEPGPANEHYVPPMTEEELTVNMQIDEELMALAVEDEDGFSSTIIIPDTDAEKMILDESAEAGAGGSEAADEAETSSAQPANNNSLFETIIMEGESVRSPLDDESRAAHSAAAAEMAAIARAKEAEQEVQSGGRRYGMIAAGVVLFLVLVGQLMHQSREALATIPAFSNTVGQIYRALGQPVQPAWDVTGWRVEASNDVTAVEDGQESLTAYSRIGNNSEQAMPYPLLAISLTDRFLEPVGSLVLDPAEYLPADLDPRKLVEPGTSFNAVIAIEARPDEATGYKVDVCYRQTDGRLRCAMDDFK